MHQNDIDFTEKQIALYEENTDKALSKYHSGFKVPVLMDD